MTYSVRSLSGWGGRPVTTSELVTPQELSAVGDVISSAGPKIARGLGRSYGDAAQLGGGLVVDMTALTGIEVDTDTGVLTALAGTSLGEILDMVVPMGWFLPVTPGTRHVTLGGALAADVHGKNHHRDGSLSAHVESFELLTGDGGVLVATPGTEQFSATVGGMGLTGIITRATLRLIPIETAAMSTQSTWAPDLEAVMEQLTDTDADHRYSVAWLDLTSDGRGRGLVMGGDHATADEIAAAGSPDGSRLVPPRSMPAPRLSSSLVNSFTVGVFNRLWNRLGRWRAGARIESLDAFFYPLDRVGNWNRLYGDLGFLQYQFVVPPDSEEAMFEIAEMLATMDTPVSLAVLKRMGTGTGGHLSFPSPGWTLAVDMPLGDAHLRDTLDECDTKVVDAGGRVYLAKDSRLRPGLMEQMYPEIRDWRETKARLDPEGKLKSNLSRRLGLMG